MGIKVEISVDLNNFQEIEVTDNEGYTLIEASYGARGFKIGCVGGVKDSPGNKRFDTIKQYCSDLQLALWEAEVFKQACEAGVVYEDETTFFRS